MSLDTTHHDAKANLETKQKALKQVAAPMTTTHSSIVERETSLLARLDTL